MSHIYGDVGISFSFPIPLFVDNQSRIALVENPIFHVRLKHIEVCHHWICEQIEDVTIKLDYIPMANQVADMFMKPLNTENFQKSRRALGLVQVKVC